MKTQKKFFFGGIVGLLLLAAVFTPLALAQGPGDQDNFGWGHGPSFGPMWAYGPGHGMMHGGFGGSEQSLITVAAEVLGLDQAKLIADLQSGQILAEVAEAQGVDPQAIVNAFGADREAVLAERVADGYLTQDQADAMLAIMRAYITARLSEPWEGQGYGPGTGFSDEDGDGWCVHHQGGQGYGMGRGGRNQPQN